MHFLYRFAHTTARLLFQTFFRFRVVHRERLIEQGPALIVCNHVSYLDPPLVSVGFDTEIYFLARKTLFDNPIFGWGIRRLNSIPVDQERADVTSLKTIIRLLKEGQRVLIFPEGARSYDGELGPAQSGTGFIIAKSRVPVVPVRIFGAYEALPRDSRKPRLVPITMVVGEPLTFTDEIDGPLKGKDLYQHLSNKVMEAIGAIQGPDTTASEG